MRILHVFFDKFYANSELKYAETSIDSEGRENSINIDCPDGMYDEVTECGCGANDVSHLNYCNKQQNVYNHPNLKN